MPKAKKTQLIGEKPSLPPLDALEAAQDRARCALEGNRKLTLSVDALRTALETIVSAEWDNQSNAAVSAATLRLLAVEGLDAYSRLTGQNWKRHKIIGNYAGDRNLASLTNDG